MLHRALPAAGLLAVLALFACGESSDRTPVSPDFRGPPVRSGCDFQNASQLAIGVFAPPLQQEVRTQISAMEAAAEGEGGPRDNIGFDILRQLAAVVNLGTQTSTPDGSAAFANAILACQSFAGQLNLPIALAPSLDPAVDGAFEVRGGTGDLTEPVVSRIPPHYSAVGLSSNVYTTENWFAGFEERVLIYGAPSPNSKAGQVAGSKAYDWNTAPLNPTLPVLAGTNSRAVVVGLCFFSPRTLLQEQGNTTDGIIVYKSAGDLESQPDSYDRQFCDLAATSRSGRLFGWLKDALLPAPLHATLLSPPGTGGLARGFSTFYVVDAGDILLELVGSLPKRPKINEPFTIRIKATAASNDAPIAGVVLTATITGNSGSFTTNPNPPTGVTGDDGIANIIFSIDKAGGYTASITTTDILNATELRSYDPATYATGMWHVNR